MLYIIAIAHDAAYRYLPFCLWISRILFPIVPLIIGSHALLRVVYHAHAKEQAKVLPALEIGTFVYTSDGAEGKVLSVFDNTLVLEGADGNKVEVLKRVVTRVHDEHAR